MSRTAFTLIIGLLLVSGLTGYAAAQAPKGAGTVSEMFPAIVQKVADARITNFDSIKGIPVVVTEQDLTEFKWRTKADLPGAKDCFIFASFAGIGRYAYSYACDISLLNRVQVIRAVRAGLGPDWQEDCPPEIKGDAICFQKHDLLRHVYIDSVVLVRSTKVFFDGVPTDIPEERVTPLGTPATNESIATAIARIENGQHSSLPSLQSGAGSGPITIQNHTRSTLTVYFSGPTAYKVVIGPSDQETAKLVSGTYKVAGELADKSVTPFYGVRDYAGGETETFYIR